MSITIRTNIASLLAQRRLGQSTYALQQSFTRLSSGLRINKAGDDAAGLAISESLKADARVFSQGIRNLNDGISLLNIAEGALRELSNILIRHGELAEQAANGTLSLTQRRALNEEANALVDEYNRIVDSTEFNDQQLLNLSVSSLRLQAGYGENGGISFGLAGELARTVGSGSFQDENEFSAGTSRLTSSVTTGDVNGDGVLDLITADYYWTADDTVSVLIGNGDGSFSSGTSFSAGNLGRLSNVITGDFNGDTIVDIATANPYDDAVSVLLGNGDGSFEAESAFSVGSFPFAVQAGDLNGDGVLDLVSSSYFNNSASVLMGNGDGSFAAKTDFVTGERSLGVEIVDLNGDSALDLIVGDAWDDTLSLLLGNGDGSFEARTLLSTGDWPQDVDSGDFDGDGIVDLVSADWSDGTVSVYIGEGNGSFGARNYFSVEGQPSSVKSGDLNGDGILDLTTVSYITGAVSVLLGNGDGSFRAQVTSGTGGAPNSVAIGDFNGDGVPDIVKDHSNDSIRVLLASTTETTTIGRLNLAWKENVLSELSTIRENLNRVNAELGAIGSVQSRLATALANLQQSRENYLAARSQIVDADMAHEAAELVKKRILQQAGAAILAQANQAPELALLLLDTT